MRPCGNLIIETTWSHELHTQLVCLPASSVLSMQSLSFQQRLGVGERDDVEIEFSPEGLGDTGIQHMMCRIPGNIRLELIAA